ncbi:MAG: hypothetical protein ABJA20_08840 [Novosphingobium sp.]
MTQSLPPLERKSAHSQAYEHYLRTGQRLTTAEWEGLAGRKFNHNHDPLNGQFASGPGGLSAPARMGQVIAPKAVVGRPPAVHTQPAPAQTRAPTIPPVKGYPEDGKHAWRQANDAIFKQAADEFNQRNGLKPSNVRYMDPKLMKAWAMVESGGSKDQFLADPFQVNKARDWDDKKLSIGLHPGQVMTPDASARAALLWLDIKSRKRTVARDGSLVTQYMGQRFAFQNYNGNTKIDKNKKEHRDNYVDIISFLYRN